MNSYEGHTPGPWSFEDTLVFTREPMETVDGGTSIEFVDIADCSSYEHHGGYDARANARLIAAAPDLLAENDVFRTALQEIAQRMDGSGWVAKCALQEVRDE